MAANIEDLRQVPYFAALADEALRTVIARCGVRECAAGELVLLKGEPCAELCQVLRGRVRVYEGSAEGREQVLRILGPGRT